MTYLLRYGIPACRSHWAVFCCNHRCHGYNQQNKQCYQHSQYADNPVCRNHWDVSYCSRHFLGYNNIQSNKQNLSPTQICSLDGQGEVDGAGMRAK